MADINKMAEQCKAMADKLFPNRTDASMYLKLYGELAEVIESHGDPDEVADVFILFLDYAARKRIDLHEAINRKLTILMDREWDYDPSTNTWQHRKTP
jgi:NTP pyrophosphatase (non-canonical NTP hydrolase)